MNKRRKGSTLGSKKEDQLEKRKKCRNDYSKTEEKTKVQSDGKKTEELSETSSLSANLTEIILKSAEIKNNCSRNSGNVPVSQRDSLTCGLQETSGAMMNREEAADVLPLSQVSSGKFVPVFSKPKKSFSNVLGTKEGKMTASSKASPENSEHDKFKADVCTPSVTRTVFSINCLQIQPSQPKQGDKDFEAQQNPIQAELLSKEAVLPSTDCEAFKCVPALEVQLDANSAGHQEIHTQEEVVGDMHPMEDVFHLTAQQQHVSSDVSSVDIHVNKAIGGPVNSLHAILSEPCGDMNKNTQAVSVMPVESEGLAAEDQLFVGSSKDFSESTLDSSKESLEQCSTAEMCSVSNNQRISGVACQESERSPDTSVGETVARNCLIFVSEQVNEVKVRRESGLELPQHPDMSAANSATEEEKGTAAQNHSVLADGAEQESRRHTEGSKDVPSLNESHAFFPAAALVTSHAKSEMCISESQLKKQASLNYCLTTTASEKKTLQNTSYILESNIFYPGPLLSAANGCNEKNDVLSKQEGTEFGSSFLPHTSGCLQASDASVSVLENKQTAKVIQRVGSDTDTELVQGVKNNYSICSKDSTRDTLQHQITHKQKDNAVDEMKSLLDMTSDLDTSNISPMVGSEAGECVPSPNVVEGIVYMEEDLSPKDQAIVPFTVFLPEKKLPIAPTDNSFSTHLKKQACPIAAGRKRNGRCDLRTPLCSVSVSQLEELKPRNEVLQEQCEMAEEDATDVVCGLITELSDIKSYPPIWLNRYLLILLQLVRKLLTQLSSRLIMSTHRELETIRRAKLRKEKQVGRFPHLAKGKSNSLYLPKGKNYKAK